MKDRTISTEQLHPDTPTDHYDQMNYFRKTAFLAVAFSTVAVLACVVGLPLAYTYIQRVHSTMLDEMDYCRSRNRDLWNEVYTVSLATGQQTQAARVARNANNGHFLFGRFYRDEGVNADAQYGQERSGYGNEGVVNEGGNAQYGSAPAPQPDNYGGLPDKPVEPFEENQSGSCGCTCNRGPPGPSGDAGPDGQDGSDGQPGTQGEPGKALDLAGDSSPPICDRACPAGPPGEAGSPGPKGPKGPSGKPGPEGQDGQPGPDGAPGSAGPRGARGSPGPKGPNGDPGVKKPTPGPAGPPGNPGQPGPAGDRGSPGGDGRPGGKGPDGPPGDPGNPGGSGSAGTPGSRGDDGDPGAPGSCDHCPQPRTPPGYRK